MSTIWVVFILFSLVYGAVSGNAAETGAAALEGAKWVEGILQNPRYAAKRALAGEILKKLEMSV